jgi:hypothetical protein
MSKFVDPFQLFLIAHQDQNIAVFDDKICIGNECRFLGTKGHQKQKSPSKNGPDKTQSKQLSRLKPYPTLDVPLLAEVNVLLPPINVKR